MGPKDGTHQHHEPMMTCACDDGTMTCACPMTGPHDQMQGTHDQMQDTHDPMMTCDCGDGVDFTCACPMTATAPATNALIKEGGD
jgi:hypothetical protein